MRMLNHPVGAMRMSAYLSFLCTFLVSVNALKQEECGIWFARSSIPNTGIGMYAGRAFEKEEEIEGDNLVPITDMKEHHPEDFHFLWDSYYWSADTLGMESEADVVNVASPGFGSAANSWLDLKNVDELRPHHSLAGLHRSKDPGAGAFSPYHNRTSITTQRIEAGQELFVSYGDTWFLDRSDSLGPIPVTGDLAEADSLLKAWERLRFQYNHTLAAVMKELLEIFAWNSPFASKSRILFALPKTWDETEHVLQEGLIPFRQKQSTQSLEWLQEHGICADNIRGGLSAIPQAGRGAFATRRLLKETIVAPLPLIQVPNRMHFELYSSLGEDKKVVGHQLLLNYCFGHRYSTLLLCPYGLRTGLINHGSGNEANVELRWSDSSRSCHNSEWFNMTVEDLGREAFAGLALELVALRDVEEGEEILLDYGSEWDDAWKEHVQSWKPTPRANEYVSADELNSDMDSILKTVFEQIEDPYEGNVILMFDLAFNVKFRWRPFSKNGTLLDFKRREDKDMKDCEILRWQKSEDGQILYSGVYVYDDNETGKERNTLFQDMPREAFVFKDLPYTADYHLPNAFRHDMRIPDSIFPEQWKNLKPAIDETSKEKAQRDEL